MSNYILVTTQYLEDYGTRHKFKGGHNFAVPSTDIGDAIAIVSNYFFKKNLEWHTLGIAEGKKYAPSVEFPIVPDMSHPTEFDFDSLEALVDKVEYYERIYVIRDGKLAETIEPRKPHYE
jgi:hypothetical protein